MSERTLISTITEMAEMSFDHPITKDNFNEWHDHWIQTAKNWRDELQNEGLTNTVAKINGCIELVIKYIPKGD